MQPQELLAVSRCHEGYAAEQVLTSVKKAVCMWNDAALDSCGKSREGLDSDGERDGCRLREETSKERWSQTHDKFPPYPMPIVVCAGASPRKCSGLEDGTSTYQT